MKVVRRASPGGGWGPVDGMAVTGRATGFDGCGGAWVASSSRRGPAPVRIVHHGELAVLPGLLESPASLRRFQTTPPLRRFAALQQSLAKLFAILENATLPVLLNIMETVDILGSYNPWVDLKDTMELSLNSRRDAKPGLRTPRNNDTRIANPIQFEN